MWGKSIVLISIIITCLTLTLSSVDKVFAEQPSFEIPVFPSCSSPQGEEKVNYSEGTHGIPGDSGAYTGSDAVYMVAEDTLIQCFCSSEGSGIQTNWWRLPRMTREGIEQLQSLGWIYVPDGAAWGLDDDSYAALNLEYACGASDEGPSGPADKTQRDRRPKMDHGGGDDGDSDGEGEAFVPGTGGSVFLPLITGDIAEAASTEAPGEEPEVLGEVGGVVEGAETCADPKLLGVLFVLQGIGFLWIKNSIEKKHLDKKKRFYLLESVLGALAFYIFWKYFCPWWDKWLSLGISVLGMYLTRRRFKKLENLWQVA